MIDELETCHLVASGVGKLWRRHRRSLPPQVRTHMAELLLLIRPHLLPVEQLGPQSAIGRSRYDVRGIAELFVAVAQREEASGKHTVPRSKLWGAIQTLCRAHPSIDTGLGIAAAYVTNDVTNMDQLCKGSNGDLWSIMQRLIEDRPGPTVVFKIKSHLEDEGPAAIANHKVSVDNFVGISFADEMA